MTNAGRLSPLPMQTANENFNIRHLHRPDAQSAKGPDWVREKDPDLANGDMAAPKFDDERYAESAQPSRTGAQFCALLALKNPNRRLVVCRICGAAHPQTARRTMAVFLANYPISISRSHEHVRGLPVRRLAAGRNNLEPCGFVVASKVADPEGKRFGL